MGTHNICPYKEVDKNYTGCDLKTTELLVSTLIGLCVEIRKNTVIACETTYTILHELLVCLNQQDEQHVHIVQIIASESPCTILQRRNNIFI